MRFKLNTLPAVLAPLQRIGADPVAAGHLTPEAFVAAGAALPPSMDRAA